jgi:hypothetical protein
MAKEVTHWECEDCGDEFETEFEAEECEKGHNFGRSKYDVLQIVEALADPSMTFGAFVTRWHTLCDLIERRPDYPDSRVRTPGYRMVLRWLGFEKLASGNYGEPDTLAMNPYEHIAQVEAWAAGAPLPETHWRADLGRRKPQAPGTPDSPSEAPVGDLGQDTAARRVRNQACDCSICREKAEAAGKYARQSKKRSSGSSAPASGRRAKQK